MCVCVVKKKIYGRLTALFRSWSEVRAFCRRREGKRARERESESKRESEGEGGSESESESESESKSLIGVSVFGHGNHRDASKK